MSPEQITIVVSVVIAIITNWIITHFAYDKGYRNKKGANLATKEDIEEITSKVESIKTQLSHQSQSKIELANKQY